MSNHSGLDPFVWAGIIVTLPVTIPIAAIAFACYGVKYAASSVHSYFFAPKNDIEANQPPAEDQSLITEHNGAHYIRSPM